MKIDIENTVYSNRLLFYIQDEIIKNYNDHQLRGFRLSSIAMILDNIVRASWGSVHNLSPNTKDTGDDVEVVEVLHKDTGKQKAEKGEEKAEEGKERLIDEKEQK